MPKRFGEMIEEAIRRLNGAGDARTHLFRGTSTPRVPERVARGRMKR